MGFFKDLFSPSTVKIKFFLNGQEAEIELPKETGSVCKKLEGKYFKSNESFQNACNFLLFCDKATREGQARRAQMSDTLLNCQGFIRTQQEQRAMVANALNNFGGYPFRTPYFRDGVELLKKRIQRHDNDIEIKSNLRKILAEYENERQERKSEVF